MNFVIDAILVAVFVFCIVFYSKKGFAASVVGFFRFWLALGLSLLLSGPVAKRLQPIVSEKIGEGNGESFFSSIVETVVSSGYVARVLAFAMMFVVSFIAIMLLEFVLRLLVKIPVVGFLNRTLGTVIGVLVGILWVQLLAIIFMAMAEYLSGSISWLSPETFDNTFITKFIYENNLFRLIFEKLTAS